jgi:cell division ATPase FtsA
VDGQDGLSQSIGMLGQKTGGRFFISFMVFAPDPEQPSVVVKELPLDVEDVVFTALASAQVVLTQHQKKSRRISHRYWRRHDRLYSLCRRCVKQSGCLGVGGDHITNDISDGTADPDDARGKIEDRRG